MPRSKKEKSFDSESPFEFVEMDVMDDTLAENDYRMDSEAEIQIPAAIQEPPRERQYQEQDQRRDQRYEEQDAHRRRRQHRASAKDDRRKNKYGWAFFLCSLFIGIGITATTSHPMGLFAGLGIGFLFFVDPIYQKLMDKIENW